ncbi:hypothetical protein [Pseudoalteromonas phenolica]|uniref:EF-hand domain-containing protein n=1 Tax=Pseudoalteromonas phenolica TaxID=161398 RepID=A0A0S2JYP4_9GAMM|nr:hypothetical protein [Pseudoalteromonas phenolica]ALO41287.1 hypothetical protein PP2015_768 [Pseudoalteromonas phenolica]
MTMKLKLCFALIGILLSAFSNNIQAHLMAPNKGTLNFDPSGGYLVLSLPVSAFTHFDKNSDKALTFKEIKSQQKAMIKYITDSLYLKSNNQKTFLSGAMLAPQRSHDVNNNQIEQIVVIGKFLLPFNNEVSIHTSLLNSLSQNEKLTITTTEKGSNSKQIFTLDGTYSDHTF